MSVDDPLLSVDEVAALLTVSKSTISRLIAAKKFATPYKIGKVHRWKRSQIIAWLDSQQEKGSE